MTGMIEKPKPDPKDLLRRPVSQFDRAQSERGTDRGTTLGRAEIEKRTRKPDI